MPQRMGLGEGVAEEEAELSSCEGALGAGPEAGAGVQAELVEGGCSLGWEC